MEEVDKVFVFYFSLLGFYKGVLHTWFLPFSLAV